MSVWRQAAAGQGGGRAAEREARVPTAREDGRGRRGSN